MQNLFDIDSVHLSLQNLTDTEALYEVMLTGLNRLNKLKEIQNAWEKQMRYFSNL